MRSSAIRAVIAVLFSVGLSMGIAPAQAAAPGSGLNDWTCVPSAAHPEPLVLLHGLGANGDLNFEVMGRYLESRGYCAYSLTYGVTTLGPSVGGLGSMPDSAAEVRAFVDRVLAATGADQVSIVAHSAGSTVATYYMKFLGGDRKVERFVGFGTNIKGTELDGLVTLMNLLGIEPVLDAIGCPACVEFSPRSDFMAELNEGGATVPGPTYTSIVTKYDEVVTPYTNGLFDAAPNAKNIVLQKRCPLDFSGHLALAVDPNVLKLVANELDPENARSFLCTPMPWAG
ncbi:alpha/beta fold hydrolase [Nocardioides sp. NPDC127503]|uniref:esterase/lipase family protein n=1 Tax=Nocardioides sp. NPDC127503 TaxID=3154516 RepID=UPI0033222BC0